MADVDDELLALVGGDESDDDGSEQEMDMAGSGSESAEAEIEVETSKGKKGSAPKNARSRKQEESDAEEGEASSVGSPASQESAPMDESDSDAGSPEPTAGAALEDDDNKYPFEGMFTSEREKDLIMGMREVERESILAERVQEIERQRQNRLLRQLVSRGDHDKKQAKKRTAKDADLEDAQRKTSRQRTKLGGGKVGEVSAAIDTLTLRRQEKSDRQRRLAEDRERNKDKNLSTANDGQGDDEESDAEWGADTRRRPSRSRTPEKKDAPLAELRDIERVRLSRSRFAHICFFPGFEKAITGCFARISIGPDPKAGDGVNLYRMALIKRFTTGKPYAMDKSNGQTFITDQYVVAAHGKAEREWPFVACSDGAFTEAEYKRYQATLQTEGLPFPKRPVLDVKIDDINNLRNRSWTDVELDEKLERERTLKKKYAPTDRNRLANAIEEAKRRGDDSKVFELQGQLDTAETPKLAWKTSLTPTKRTSGNISQQDRLAQLNIENRRRNEEAVRKAQLREKAKAREVEARLARGEEVKEDTSRRVRTQPKFLQDLSEAAAATPNKGSTATTPANGTPKLEAKKEMLPHIAKLQAQSLDGKDKKGMPQIHRPLMDDDIIGALDLDIDVDIE